MHTRTTTPRRPTLAGLVKAGLVVMGVASVTGAQDLVHKAPPQAEAISIIGATVHPISGPPIEDGVVTFEDGRITWIGGRAEFDPAMASRLVHADGMHVYPGLVSADTRMGLTEISAVRASEDDDEVGAFTPEVRASVSVNPDSTLIPVTRANGILTVATLPSGGTIPGRASVIAMDGWTWEDMTILDDAGLVVNWPRMRSGYSAFGEGRPVRDSLDDLRTFFDEADAYLESADATDLRYESVRPVIEGEAPLLVRADDLEQITAAVRFCAERGFRMVLMGGHDAPMCADLLRAHDVGVIVEGTYQFPHRDDAPYDEAYTLPSRLEALGVRWCLASGTETAHERELPYNASCAAAYGLSREAAIRSVTESAARILGIEDLGTLEVGHRATLIVTTGDPLEIRTRRLMAFIDGREIELTDKQQALAEKYRAKYRQR